VEALVRNPETGGGGGLDGKTFISDLERIGFSGWVPPGHFDSQVGVWVTDDRVEASFPESGVDLFNALDQHSFWFDHRNSVISDVLQREVPPGQLLLEVGSGSGVVIDFVRRFTDRPVVSVEPVPEGAATVACRGVGVSFCGDLHSVGFPDGSIPAVGAFDVVEHLDDPLAFLAECRRILSPDGVLLVTVPAFQWLWSEHDSWNGHVQRFTRSGLRALLAEAGFEPLTQTYFFLPLLVPAIVDRLLLARFRNSADDSEIESHIEGALAPSSSIVDWLLRFVLRGERKLLRRFRLPFGTSILMTARRTSG
jgi:SAM-dependent methyltransferase